MKIPLSALIASYVNATHVSVCHDATYDVPLSRGAVCVGTGSVPFGSQCPRQGDRAVQHCLPSMSSYVRNGYCSARENAVCKLVRNDTWGCVLPSIKCEREIHHPESKETCVSWPYQDNNQGLEFQNDDLNDQRYDEAWFQQETPLSNLGHLCGSPAEIPKSTTKFNAVESKPPAQEACFDSTIDDVSTSLSNSVTYSSATTYDSIVIPVNKGSVDKAYTELDCEGYVDEQVDCDVSLAEQTGSE
ncbi:unnamed protein product [Albugo candida]|uniref:Uncharacterized protein n=1 Tax=Albugo candida TaxID=65357 RepID=A0A024GR53_9STRA|nr:unnamed protein product [Albugo candida]|eukprot:CCI48833.1 unnamed protein product [Albugo candida]